MSPILDELKKQHNTKGLVIKPPPEINEDQNVKLPTTRPFDKITGETLYPMETHTNDGPTINNKDMVLIDIPLNAKRYENDDGLNIYTDGSYMKKTATAGAGIYIGGNTRSNTPDAMISYTFGGDQTILRAELLAIRAAVQYAANYEETPVTVNIFTDSLSSIYLLLRWKM